jgi:hypothetical protein
MSYGTAVTEFGGEAAVSYRCATCCIAFAIPQSLSERWERGDRSDVYCPNGHVNVLVHTEAARLRDELTREKHRTEQARADAEYQSKRRAFAERRASAARGQVTKIKNRVKNGVCPVCNRTFGDLARHMHGQHPHFGEVDA